MMANGNGASAGITFQLTEEQKMIQKLARDFARKEIAPHAEHHDKTHEYPWEIVKKAQELGLTTINVPEEYGGLGLNLFEEMLVAEELAWGCSGISLCITINNLASLPLLIAANDEQKQEYFGRLVDGKMAAYALTEPSAGSDVLGIRTTARKDGDYYVLNGTKTFITGATVADWFTVFAYTNPEAKYRGMSAFIVDRNTPGVSVSKPFDKLGQRASDTAEIILEDVRVPAKNMLGKEGEGFFIAMKVFDRSRPGVAAAAVGIAQRAFDEAMQYALERQTMGKPIYKHQAIGHMLADMATKIEASRLLTWQAAIAFDEGHPSIKLASMAKSFAADTGMQICTDAVQVFGGYGFITEYPVEKLMRDMKIMQIYEGTSQIQRYVIIRELAKEYS